MVELDHELSVELARDGSDASLAHQLVVLALLGDRQLLLEGLPERENLRPLHCGALLVRHIGGPPPARRNVVCQHLWSRGEAAKPLMSNFRALTTKILHQVRPPWGPVKHFQDPVL